MASRTITNAARHALPVHCTSSSPRPVHCRRLILLQVGVDFLDTILGDDHHLQTITDLDMPLYRRGEGVLDDALDLVPGHGLRGLGL